MSLGTVGIWDSRGSGVETCDKVRAQPTGYQMPIGYNILQLAKECCQEQMDGYTYQLVFALLPPGLLLDENHHNPFPK